jgi:Na+-transporting NADH:ubiquinone oxidoreductase subunit NqrB
MLVFGLLVMRGAWKAVRGEHDALSAPCAIGLFYLATGVVALSTMHEPFWSVFVVLGGLALALSSVLGFVPATPRTASRMRQPAA